MQIEIGEIKLVQGQFHVYDPEKTGLNAPDEKRTLVISCDYGLFDKNGTLVAQGQISNAAEGRVRPSPETLNAFSKFFMSLEHDVANALSGNQEQANAEEDGNILAKYMGQPDTGQP